MLAILHIYPYFCKPCVFAIANFSIMVRLGFGNIRALLTSKELKKIQLKMLFEW